MDIESEDFYKRIAQAYELIESRDDESFRYWSNVLLADAMLISVEMFSRIVRIPETRIFSQLAYGNYKYVRQRSFPIALIPNITNMIGEVKDLFWYADKDDPNQEYPLPSSELPQYLYFLMKKLNTPERTNGYDTKEINSMLPDKWRKFL